MTLSSTPRPDPPPRPAEAPIRECPNLECRSREVEVNDSWDFVFVRCYGCGMTGPAVEASGLGEGGCRKAAYASAVYAWNYNLPRGGGPDDLM